MIPKIVSMLSGVLPNPLGILLQLDETKWIVKPSKIGSPAEKAQGKYSCKGGFFGTAFHKFAGLDRFDGSLACITN